HVKQYDKAEPLFRDLLEKQARLVGRDDPRRVGTLHNFAALFRDQGRYAEAEALSAEAVAGARVSRPNGNWMSAFIAGHAQALVGLGRFEDAERDLIEAQAICEH